MNLLQQAVAAPDPEADAILEKRKFKKTRFPDDIRGSDPNPNPTLVDIRGRVPSLPP